MITTRKNLFEIEKNEGENVNLSTHRNNVEIPRPQRKSTIGCHIKRVEATHKIRHKCLKGYNDKSRTQSTPYELSRPLNKRISSTSKVRPRHA